MWDLSKHEQLEIEMLNGLNSRKILGQLIFCGGTMLRLCHELNRYSVDLDFWLTNKDKEKEVYEKIKEYLTEFYRLKKSSNKHASISFEFAAAGYPRNLLIEIRKETRDIKYEEKIAFSKHSSAQVITKAATLGEMMKSKIDTFLERVRIRDAFDIEFLLRRGIKLDSPKSKLKEMEKLIRRFKAKDYRITLGALLEFKDRQYYKNANFRYLLEHINRALDTVNVKIK